MKKLTPKQLRFVDEYMIDLNAKMIVYIAINTVNNKIYVGATTGKLGRRIKNHYSGAIRKDDIINSCRDRGGAKFHNAIREYGKNIWQWRVVDRCKNKSELDRKEAEVIKELNTYKNGYNETLGGVGTRGLESWNKGKRGLQEAWNKGLSCPIEVREKISRANVGKMGLIGKRNPLYGKPAHNRRKVIAIDVEKNKTIGRYDSVFICGKELPISHGSVKKILLGVFDSIKGITVKYCET